MDGHLHRSKQFVAALNSWVTQLLSKHNGNEREPLVSLSISTFAGPKLICRISFLEASKHHLNRVFNKKRFLYDVIIASLHRKLRMFFNVEYFLSV